MQTRTSLLSCLIASPLLAAIAGGAGGTTAGLLVAAALALLGAWLAVRLIPGQQPAITTPASAVTPAGVREGITAARADAVALSAAVVDLLTSAEATRERATAVAGAAERVSADTQSIAAGSEQMSATVREIAGTTGEAARIASEAAGLAGQAEAAVKRLGDSSQGIGAVVETIAGIAGQTNLLALNATIEAARAGEAGRGFAVVAGEVKALARQTAESTADVGRRIAAIQADTAAAITAIGAITARIGRLHEVQQTVASAVEEQSATTQEMSRTIAGTAQGARAIASGIAGVSADATQAAIATVTVRDLAGRAVAAGEAALNASGSAVGADVGLPGEFFDRAIRAHLAWRTRLLAAADGGIAPDRATAADADACDLARSLAAERARLATHPDHAALLAAHDRFHEEVGAVLGLIADGKRDVARTAIATGSFAQASERMVRLLAGMKPLGSTAAASPLAWKDEYATGVAAIDAQHRELFAKVGALHSAMMSGAGRAQVGELVGFLADYTIGHFRDEEALMQRAGYAELAAHRAKHAELLAQVGELRTRIERGDMPKTMEVTDFLAAWLRHHILRIDHAYVPAMRAAGVG